MGNQSLLIVGCALLLAAGLGANLAQRDSDMSVNTANSLARTKAKELNYANMQLAMRQLADNTSRRSPISIPNFNGGESAVSFRDTVIGKDTLITVYGRTTYVVGSDTGVAESQTSVIPNPGFVPITVRGAVTTFGPIDDLIGDMFIDGREHDLNNIVIPNKGIYAVSTGAATFTNKIGAYLGGTYISGGAKRDQVPQLSTNPLIIETHSQWPNGWPATPDRALGLPEGTLKMIAQSGVDGSRYITSNAGWPKINVPNQPGGQFILMPPLKGVTFVELPPATQYTNVAIRKGSEGLLVWHSSATDAYLYRIAMENDDKSAYFKGLMIYDRIFHIHINILGGLIHLSPNTTRDNCPGNKDHWVNYSSAAIKASTKISSKAKGGWRSQLAVQNWTEKSQSYGKGEPRGNGNGNRRDN